MSDTQKIGSEFLVNTTTEERQQNPDITSFSNGRYVITWESVSGSNGWEIIAQRYNPSGLPLGEEFIVNTTSPGPQLTSSVSDLTDGGFVVTWRSDDGSGDGVFAQRYDSNGDPVGEEFQVNTFTNGNQRLAPVNGLTDGGFVIIWQSEGQDGSGWGIYGKRYNANGEVVGEEFQVNTLTESDQQLPSVTNLADGGFVVTWDSGGLDPSSTGVVGKRYDANGVPLGEEFLVNTTTESTQSNSSITDLADGGFVVTWQSSGQDGSSTGIAAQLYNANGEKVGEEFLVNTTTEGQQTNPYIAQTNNGGFVITWQGQTNDVDWNVFGQAYDSSGNPLGAEFLVNTVTEGTQWTPAVAASKQNDFVVAWSSEGQDGDQTGIFGQRFGTLEPTTGELAPTAFEVINPSQTAGNDVQIEFAVENTAAESVGPFDVDFYISDNFWISDNDLFLASYTIEELAGNSVFEENSGSATVTLPPTGDSFWSLGDGTYYIGMIVDGKNTVIETDEENNSNQGELVSYDELVVENTADADLAAVPFGFDVITEPANTGDAVDILFTVQNTGAGTTGQFDVDFYISENIWISEGDKLLGSYTVDSLQGNDTFSNTTSLELPGAGDAFWNGSKNYYIGIMIDGKNTVFETNENNNVNVGYGVGDYGKFTGWDDVNITIL